MQDRIRSHGNVNLDYCTIITNLIVNESIFQISKILDPNKCAGPDGVSPVFIKSV